ncbi:hypothetical protein DL766_003736 [Monosporascus sp. MC13-8B]|uniref:Beta-glucuronidase C-terminal domain-containing protein n=1 Tax=Monosporascus cannonballus TaxID=155416 RepID=A0ABY0GZG2_9PEZI|nr:hypothetical protein DL763_010314 [Monosporascus cannonballus]RYO80359.1 hypothetical protein DL762_007684 [Monosporascus cannonballus]RYP32930.1 hypothetical protein DL766_003736 [Monosporascus sp. MC13-8B]
MFTIPSQSGTGGYKYSPVDPAPVGISFEFFAFPSCFTNVTATQQCLANWRDLTGAWPPIRIGGTTQDRALYDAASSAYVAYSVAGPRDAPMSLTYGPRFLTLAGQYGGSVVLSNTIEAAKRAVAEVRDWLLAIELGNEPEYYDRAPVQPIARNGWSPDLNAASQNEWHLTVGRAIGSDRMPLMQAGNWDDSPPKWGAAQLIAKQNATVEAQADIAAVLREGKPYVLGETNSVSGGGAADVSPTFCAALWTMDYVLRAVYTGISRIYFHHSTVGNCQYCFWGRYSMGAPYYGATTATAFLAQARTMTALDDGNGAYVAYASFNASGTPLRLLLFNSDYFESGSRSAQTFVLRGLSTGKTAVRAKRLTAAAGALARQDRGQAPTFGGRTFADGTCVPAGGDVFEEVPVGAAGEATISVGATEAVLVYLQ